MLLGEGVPLAEADARAAGQRCAEHRVEELKGEGMKGLKIEVTRWERHVTQAGEYLGYPRTLAGPYRMGFDGTREEVVSKYKSWLWDGVKSRKAEYRKLTELLAVARGAEGLRLVCVEPEFGEVIRRCLEWMEKQEKSA